MSKRVVRITETDVTEIEVTEATSEDLQRLLAESLYRDEQRLFVADLIERIEAAGLNVLPTKLHANNFADWIQDFYPELFDLEDEDDD